MGRFDEAIKNITIAIQLKPDFATAYHNRAQVYGMKADVEKTTRQVQSDKTLTSEQRKEKLQTIRAETEAEVTRQLGERGYKAYKNNNGWWIRNISPN